MFSRILSAALGGYVFTSLASALMAALLSPSKADAAMFAMQVSFILYALIVMWAFYVQRQSTLWLGLGLASLLCFVLLQLVKPGLN